MYQISELQNGLRICSAFLPGMESETIGVWVRGGGRYENHKNAGIFHFIEHLLFKGTRKRSALEIKEEIEGGGGSLNGFTAEEFTCFYAKVLKDQTAVAMDVLADMVLNARLSEKDIKKERSVVIEEIKMYWDQPASYVHDLLNELLWPGHPLGMYLAGTPQTVGQLTVPEIRRYKRDYYFPVNMLVVAAGPVRHADLAGRCQRTFRSVSGRIRPKLFKKFAGRSSERGNPVCFRTKTTEQTHLCMGFRTGGRYHPERYPLTILNIVLGGNMSSRLFQEVRERRGLAYDIGSHVRLLHDTGAFVISAGVENEKMPGAVKVILQELKKIASQKIPARELDRAKEFYRGQLLLGLEDTSEQMMWLGESVLTMGRAVDVKEILKNIEMISAESVYRAARRFLKQSNFHLAAIGPLPKSQRIEIQKEVQRS